MKENAEKKYTSWQEQRLFRLCYVFEMYKHISERTKGIQRQDHAFSFKGQDGGDVVFNSMVLKHALANVALDMIRDLDNEHMECEVDTVIHKVFDNES